MIDIDRLENQAFGHEELGFDKGPHELLRRHAVVADKAHGGKWRYADDTHPAHGFHAEIRADNKVQRHGHAAGADRKKELPQRQSEEHGFGIRPNLPVDFDFQ